MTDWHSYDPIANHYDRVWASRFAAVAKEMWALMPSSPGQNILDLGTGTGIVPSLLSEDLHRSGLMVGCDKSRGMLDRAKTKLPWLHVLVAEITALPFVDESFDLATASFVISHVREYPCALAEVFRVLKSSGTLAVSAWAPLTDPWAAAWKDHIAKAISTAEADRALAQVAPLEEHFSVRGNLAAALTEAGFSNVSSHSLELEFTLTVDEFLDDREISSTGRLGRQILGPMGWVRFRAAAAEMFQARFGRSLQCHRTAFIVICRKP
ncbi:MAG TPA: methyltransferase domain-containing protein [Blastocatellia bacterium]|nr:methyltransferase domain-containing protein [Blastocatellia bacterium]